jgi:hypothetical protein
MPIDPRIPLMGQTAPIQSPLEAISTIAQLQGIREQTEARRLAAEAARQKAAETAAVHQVLTETGGDMQQALPRLRMIAPTATAALEKEWEAANKDRAETAIKNTQLKKDQLMLGLQALQSATPDNYEPAVRPMIAALSPDAAKLLPPTYDKPAIESLLKAGLSTHDLVTTQLDALRLYTDGHPNEALSTVLSKADTPAKWTEGIANARAMNIPEAIIKNYGDWSPDAPARAAQLGITPEKRATLAGQAEARQLTAAGQAQTAAHQAVTEAQGAANVDLARQRLALARQRVAQGTGTDTDAKAIAAAIVSGDQPPTLQGLYRYAAPVRAELSRQGYNLGNAQLDWSAAQQHFKTLNGAQQTRLRQAVDTATHSLDVIDTLAGQWHGGRFPILNRANLALAKNGAYGADVASTARQLDAQIADVTAELANAYMGGNSPTDHALQLAAKNLSSDWSEKTLKDMTALARTNLTIRQNAIRNVGAIGASDVNPYVPTATPPVPGGSSDALSVTAPNGKTYTFKSAAEAAAFKRRAGIS